MLTVRMTLFRLFCITLWCSVSQKTLEKNTCKNKGSRDSAVGIATGYGLDEQGVWSSSGGKNFHFSISSRPALGPTQPPIQWVPGALSSGVKGPGREADHSN
jgi:hypothetical protein